MCMASFCREEDTSECHGHITSVAVARTHRKLGLATRLMTATRKWHTDALAATHFDVASTLNVLYRTPELIRGLITP